MVCSGGFAPTNHARVFLLVLSSDARAGALISSLCQGKLLTKFLDALGSLEEQGGKAWIIMVDKAR